MAKKIVFGLFTAIGFGIGVGIISEGGNFFWILVLPLIGGIIDRKIK